MTLSLKDYFTYHPPRTDERKHKHDDINNAALNFAEVIERCVKDEQLKQFAMLALQQARMISNQAITVDELRGLNEN